MEARRPHNPQIKARYTSTRQIYGRPLRLRVVESHPPLSVDVNGVNKLAGEWYHLVCHRSYGLDPVSLLLTNTYSPRLRVTDARQTVLGWCPRHGVEGQALKVFGNGEQMQDFNSVGEVVEALLLASARPEATGEIYKLGGD